MFKRLMDAERDGLLDTSTMRHALMVPSAHSSSSVLVLMEKHTSKGESLLRVSSCTSVSASSVLGSQMMIMPLEHQLTTRTFNSAPCSMLTIVKPPMAVPWYCAHLSSFNSSCTLNTSTTPDRHPTHNFPLNPNSATGVFWRCFRRSSLGTSNVSVSMHMSASLAATHSSPPTYCRVYTADTFRRRFPADFTRFSFTPSSPTSRVNDVMTFSVSSVDSREISDSDVTVHTSPSPPATAHDTAPFSVTESARLCESTRHICTRPLGQNESTWMGHTTKLTMAVGAAIHISISSYVVASNTPIWPDWYPTHTSPQKKTSSRAMAVGVAGLSGSCTFVDCTNRNSTGIAGCSPPSEDLDTRDPPFTAT
mmetsp:Transcript_43818/g.110486  ORF Transcript_43818/g.110486 Transcript_43818/m.110486 type:complete len:365 (-) Transcript_43818:424-1518(-)